MKTLILIGFLTTVVALENYYEILGLDQDTDKKEIKRTYRALALEWHPDKSKHPHADAVFSAIGKAYEVLSSEKERRIYDQKWIFFQRTGNDGDHLSFDSEGNLQDASQHTRSVFHNALHGPPILNMGTVLTIGVVVLSALQHAYRVYIYKHEQEAIRKTTQYQMASRFMQDPTKKSKRRKKDGGAAGEDEEDVVVEVGKPPQFTEVFGVRLLLLPYTAFVFFQGIVKYRFLGKMQPLDAVLSEEQQGVFADLLSALPSSHQVHVLSVLYHEHMVKAQFLEDPGIAHISEEAWNKNCSDVAAIRGALAREDSYLTAHFFDVFPPLLQYFTKAALGKVPVLGTSSAGENETRAFYEMSRDLKVSRDVYVLPHQQNHGALSAEDVLAMVEAENVLQHRLERSALDEELLSSLITRMEQTDPRVLGWAAAAAAKTRTEADAKRAAKDRATQKKQEDERQQQAILSEQEGARKAQAKALKKTRQRARQLTKDICDTVHVGEVVSSFNIEDLSEAEEFVARLESARSDEETRKVVSRAHTHMMGERKRKEEARLARKKAQQAKLEAEQKTSKWTKEELSVLAKGLQKYPGGVQDRWGQVANFLETQHGSTRTPAEVAKKATAIKRRAQR